MEANVSHQHQAVTLVNSVYVENAIRAVKRPVKYTGVSSFTRILHS